MNKRADLDILQYLTQNNMTTQRELAEKLGYSLGSVNQGLGNLRQLGYLDDVFCLTDKAWEFLADHRPERAIILAAGSGMRMVPANRTFSKAMLEVHGEILIERLIEQLHIAGVDDIYIVVGFMKEQFEYLIDQYGVKLIVNREYDLKNNMESLRKVRGFLRNTYIVPCDIWCEKNPFHRYEPYPWYLVKKETDVKSDVYINRKGELIKTGADEPGNIMMGISYLDSAAGEYVGKMLDKFSADARYDDSFWEETLYDRQKMVVQGKIAGFYVHEINTYEDLRDIDSDSGHLDSDAICLLSDIFGVDKQDIKDIKVLKAGMTNRSFEFVCKGRRYIMRIPGEGTAQMIDRRQEYEVYQMINREHICDEVVYMNPDNGYKVTAFIENARNCDPDNADEVSQCMRYLRAFHEKKFKVGHTFDLFQQIDFYESLWNGNPSAYRDYQETKENVFKLRAYIEAQPIEKVLTHIDAVPDNFLFTDEGIRLIDWEYAGMQDPHVDIAMFAIYSMYDPEQVEQLIDFYFTEGCPIEVRKKIYCYIAAAGLLWSNWCEYKRQLGVEFGEYSLRQYRYAKDYYRLFLKLGGMEED